MDPLNIIYFHTHDMGRWIEPYGCPVNTPNLTRFADRALLFRKAFCAAPTCSPSRAALLTGCSPHSVNMLGLAHRGFGPVEKSRHLSTYLARHGYETALSGVQHEGTNPQNDLSYDQILYKDGESRETRDLDAAEKAARWLAERDSTRPFFLALGTFFPHRDFPEPDPKDNPDRLTPPYPVSDTPEGRVDFAGYRAAVAVADRALGILMDELDRKKLWESTLVIVTTDHGPAFPNMKCNLLDTGIGVSLLWHHPGLKHAGRATEALTSHIDLFPTLCDVAGLPKPEWLQGTSLLPVLEDPTASVRAELFAEVTYHAAYEPMRAVRTDRYKLIQRYDPERLRVILPNVDEGPELSRLLKHGWNKFERNSLELYDLATDPFETRNRINDPLLASVQQDLLNRLEAWMKKTNDPLRQHCPRVPAPKGAKINTLDAPSNRSNEMEET